LHSGHKNSAVATVSTMVAAVVTPSALPHHATLQHSNNATLITCAIIVTTKTMGMVGYFVFSYLLTYVCSMCCPYLHKLMLSSHPTDTLRGNLFSSLFAIQLWPFFVIFYL